MSYKKHFFICTHEKTTGSCCAAKGSKQLRDNLKNEMAKHYGKEVRVNAAGCLGYCAKGINIVSYPQGDWLFEQKLEDQADILQWMKQKVEEV